MDIEPRKGQPVRRKPDPFVDDDAILHPRPDMVMHRRLPHDRHVASRTAAILTVNHGKHAQGDKNTELQCVQCGIEHTVTAQS